MRLNIRVAKTAGFCFGVQRALDRVLELVNNSKKPVRTVGPLIHNDQVLQILHDRGVWELNESEELRELNVVIRAHGVSPDALNRYKKDEVFVCNATCPKVAQVQGIVKKYAHLGYMIVIIGDRGHAEVEGLLGYAHGNGHAISGSKEVEFLPDAEKVCIVAQTTQSTDTFKDTVNQLKARYKEVEAFNTICNATSERQLETRRLAQQSDLMIVVGGKNSANTKRLVEISSEICPTYAVHSADDISLDMIGDSINVGVTAGASTPTWVIQQVVDRLNLLGWSKTGIFHRFLYDFLNFSLQTNLILSFGSLVVFISAANLMDTGFSYLAALFSFWFPLSATNLSTLLQKSESAFQLPARRNIVRENPMVALVVILFFTAIAFVMAVDSGKKAVITFFALVFSIMLFSIPVDFRILDWITRKLRLIVCVPSNFIFSLGMGYTAFPFVDKVQHAFMNEQFVFGFASIVLMNYIRLIILDVRMMQADLMRGRQTLPLKLGKERVRYLLALLLFAWCISSVILILVYSYSFLYLLLAIPSFYCFGYLVLYHRRIIFMSLTSDLALDATIWLTAAIYWFVSMLS